MKSSLYRQVCVFDEKCNHGDGELLFSFDIAACYLEGTSSFLHVHEFLVDGSILASEFTVTLFFDKPSSKITLERNHESQLVPTNIFVFEKPSARGSWVLLVNGDEKLLSYAGSHSLTMLANEITARATQEH